MDEPNVIPFPPWLRVAGAPADAPSPSSTASVLVEHAVRAYQLADLIVRLPSRCLAEIAAAAPPSWQATWDEVVRRWPALAKEIAAGCEAVE